MEMKRRYMRWNIGTSAKVRLAELGEFINCNIVDINYKGIQLSLEEKLSLDAYIKLSITLSSAFTLEVEAWVAWHKTVDGHHLYGLYFTKIRDQDKEKLHQFIYKNSPEEMSKQWWQDLPEMAKGGETMEDRRIFDRFKAALPLRFLKVSENREGTGQTADISAKGIGLVADVELAPNTPLEMWLEIPDKGEPLYTRGEVVWSKMMEPNKFRIGVNLEKADLMGLSRVLRVV